LIRSVARFPTDYVYHYVCYDGSLSGNPDNYMNCSNNGVFIGGKVKLCSNCNGNVGSDYVSAFRYGDINVVSLVPTIVTDAAASFCIHSVNVTIIYQRIILLLSSNL
jgi:hypothetical protein